MSEGARLGASSTNTSMYMSGTSIALSISSYNLLWNSGLATRRLLRQVLLVLPVVLLRRFYRGAMYVLKVNMNVVDLVLALVHVPVLVVA